MQAPSGAFRERLDALGGADERHHDEDADREQHGLQDVRAGVVEPEQDRERPAAGERRAEHLGADQDRRRMTVTTLGQTIWREPEEEGCVLMGIGPVAGRNLSEKAGAIKRKRPKKAGSRDIDCRKSFEAQKREL